MFFVRSSEIWATHFLYLFLGGFLMKKIASLIMAVIMLISLFTFNVSAQENVLVYIDGEKIEFDVQPQIINGRTLVPMRKIFEELGATVDWDDSTQTAIGTKENTVVKFTINDYTMYKNESAKTLDVPAQLINGRTLIPLRAVSEAFECQVGWDGNGSIVSIIDDSENYTMLYALGDRSKSFPSNTIDAQLTVGWYTEPVQILYALGKSAVFKQSEVDAQLAVGWYTEPICTMYAPDGRSINISESEVEIYKKVGWYTNVKDAIASNYPKHNVRILEVDFETNTVGGIEPEIRWRNDSGKTIKYIYFTCVPYNRVGDIESCRISGDSYVKLKATGPFKTFTVDDIDLFSKIYYKRTTEYIYGSTTGNYHISTYNIGSGHEEYYLNEDDFNHVYNHFNIWDPAWYDISALKNIVITQIDVTYMDETTEKIYNPPIWKDVFKNAGI